MRAIHPALPPGASSERLQAPFCSAEKLSRKNRVLVVVTFDADASTFIGTLFEDSLVNDTNWAVAYSTFRTFKHNLPLLINEDCVSEYHAILDSLEKAGKLKLDEYQIDPLRLSFRLERSHSANASTPNLSVRTSTQYSNKRYCDTEYFHWMLSKVEAAIARSRG